MAQNLYVNKVQNANGSVIMDISNDTATPSDVLNGATFHDRSGAPQTGSVITHNVYDGLDSTSTSDALSANQGKVLNSKINSFNSILYDEVATASKQYQIPARTAVLILARCNANQTSTAPEITITGQTQTAKNTGAVGGSCMCYMVYGTSNDAENITITFNNYTHGGTYDQYGRVSIIKLNTY